MKQLHTRFFIGNLTASSLVTFAGQVNETDSRLFSDSDDTTAKEHDIALNHEIIAPLQSTTHQNLLRSFQTDQVVENLVREFNHETVAGQI